jgi:hypothetical protein
MLVSDESCEICNLNSPSVCFKFSLRIVTGYILDLGSTLCGEDTSLNHAATYDFFELRVDQITMIHMRRVERYAVK